MNPLGSLAARNGLVKETCGLCGGTGTSRVDDLNAKPGDRPKPCMPCEQKGHYWTKDPNQQGERLTDSQLQTRFGRV